MLTPWKESYDQPRFKSRDITLPTKVRLVEATVFHLMQRVDSLEKTLMLGGIWGQEEKGTTKIEMAGWHHQLDGGESE